MTQDRGITPMLLFAIFSAVLGMFQFGYNTGVINAPQDILKDWIAKVYKSRTGDWISEERRDLIWSIIVSVFAIGGMVGGLMAPTVANWCGRKTGLVLNNTIAVLGVTLMSSSQLSQSIECLVAGRFFIGLNCGLNTALVPMYLSEIATVNVRGALGTVSQLGVTIGLLFSQILGLKEILGTQDHWPFLFGFAYVPAILQLVMLPFCPESPRYLLLNCSRISEARLALRRLRSSSDIEPDIDEMRAEDEAHQEEIQRYGNLTSVRELFNHPWLRAPLIIGIMMQLSQQLSGINAIFYYSTEIFRFAEVPGNYATYATIGVGVTMVVTTLVSIPLMDRLGRRTLHLYGLAGMFLASIFLTISLLVKFLYDWMLYISVISILFCTLFFGIGPGSIPFLITAELFTQGTRPAAMSVSVLANWFSNFIVGLTFPLLLRHLGSYIFLPYTVFLAIFWIFTYKKLPETKNRTFEEIAALFKPSHLGPGSPRLMTNYGCTSVEGISGTSDSTCQTMNQIPGCQTNISYQADGQRFQFGESTGNNGQAQVPNVGCCNQGNFFRESQGNVNAIPHNSYSSIGQNLSISDQQPLIIQDNAQLEKQAWCRHAYLGPEQSPYESNDGYPQMCGAQGSLKTTSFMALGQNCTCSAGRRGGESSPRGRHSIANFVCDFHGRHPVEIHQHHNELFGSTVRRNWIANNNYDDDEENDERDREAKRSKTLGRSVAYKSLANGTSRNLSTNDLSTSMLQPHQSRIEENNGFGSNDHL